MVPSGPPENLPHTKHFVERAFQRLIKLVNLVTRLSLAAENDGAIEILIVRCHKQMKRCAPFLILIFHDVQVCF